MTETLKSRQNLLTLNSWLSETRKKEILRNYEEILPEFISYRANHLQKLPPKREDSDRPPGWESVGQIQKKDSGWYLDLEIKIVLIEKMID